MFKALRPNGRERKAGHKWGGSMKARGIGSLYRRETGIWWIQYYNRGQLNRESSGSRVRAEAASLLKKRIGDIAQGRFVGARAEKLKFDDLAVMLVDDYRVNSRKSLDRAERSIDHLRVFFGRYRAVEITPDRVSAYIRFRLESEVKPATIKLELAALGRMFTLAVLAGKVAVRPRFPSIEVRNTRTGFFEDEDLKAVLDELPEHLKPVIQFTHLTGWRRSEVTDLQWRQVDFTAGTVRLEPGTTKNDEGRMFPFSALPALEALLREQRERTTALERRRGVIIPFVFHCWGKQIRNFHEAWRAACDRAKVEGRFVHDLRRTAVRNLERASVPRSWAMKLTGHKTESVYRRYAIVSEADLFEGVEKLAALKSRTISRRVASITTAGEVRTSTEPALSGEKRD
jgi:integrase